MATPKEIDKDQADRLFELLIIEKNNQGTINPMLTVAINRAKASMTKEAIAWVEQHVN